MAIVIASTDKEKVFETKEFITVGSNENCDYCLKTNFDFMLTVQCNSTDKKITIINNFNTDKIMFKGKPIGSTINIENLAKFIIADCNEFISIKYIENSPVVETVTSIGEKDLTESDIKEIYGDNINAATKIKLEKKKADLERSRITVTKETSFAVNDIKKRISLNFKAAIALNTALFFSAMITAFGISNYFLGLPITQTGSFLNMPTNIKFFGVFIVIVFGISLILKQGVYLLFQNKTHSSASTLAAQKFMIAAGTVFITAFFAINMIYYMNPDNRIAFAILISLFITSLTAALSVACGYFKYASHELSANLDKYEYREDLENVMGEYQLWIEKYINNLSSVKLGYIKDKLFMMQIKSVGETILGIITAPFLAYGVSNTLAMCFPEAAGWIRISGMRFSPVFLVLATLLIVFAFFAFVNAFLCIKKINGSDVIKNDGFRNYSTHGTDIFGLENIRKFNLEKTRSFVIAISIIFIEFSMNVSYFMTEIGGDFKGLFLSLVAALVPTALLIAETYMLGQTKYDIYVRDELISKLDRN